MSSLRETRNKPSHGISSNTAVKRKLPVDCAEKVVYKENKLAPKAPTRTKRQKLSKTPVKPPRYVDPTIERLKKQIEREYSIRDGGAKLLQVSKTNRQNIEASKGLFVSDAKIIGLMRELQDKQNLVGKLSPPDTSLQLKPCRAKIGISEIRIPLEWREFENAKGKLDSNLHGVFCLFRIGNQVMDTPTLVEIDRTTMDITFKDIIIFPELVGPEFTLGVEVYCSLPAEEVSAKPSTPIKILKKLRHKDKPEESPAHVKSVPPSLYTPQALNVTPSYRFALAGYAQLDIKDVTESCRTFALKRGMVGSCGTSSTGGTDDPLLLPLWGQICCCLMAQPECATEMRMAGFINVQRMVGGLPDWKRLWCVMRQNHMRCWSCPEDVGKRMPVHTIELTKSMTVESAPRLSMRRPNALLLKDRSLEFFMAFESKENKVQWIDTINQGILDLNVWQSSCEFTIPVPHSKFYTDSSPSSDDIPTPTTTTTAAKSLPRYSQSAKSYTLLASEDETIL